MKLNTKTLKQILDVCEDFSHYGSKIDSWEKESERMYDQLKGIEFNENDLQMFIYAKASTNDLEPYSLEATALGRFSGVLLDLLTERNKEQDRGTRFYVNGHGQTFNHLFAHAKDVDSVVVDNFRGDNICANITRTNLVAAINSNGFGFADRVGSEKGGKVSSVILMNGAYHGSAQRIGENEGYADSVLFLNAHGPDMGNSIGGNGRVNSVYFINSESHMGLQNLGRLLAKYAVKSMIDKDFEVDRNLVGYVGRVITYNSSGHKLGEACEAKKWLNGYGQDYIQGIIDEYRSVDLDATMDGSLEMADALEAAEDPAKILGPDLNMKQHPTYHIKQDIEKLIAFGKQLENATEEQVWETLDEIQEVYKGIENKTPL